MSVKLNNNKVEKWTIYDFNPIGNLADITLRAIIKKFRFHPL